MDPTGEKKKRPSKENLNKRSTGSHNNNKFETRPIEKQRGMVFGLQKMVTAVIKSEGWKDRRVGGWVIGRTDRRMDR
jgi:hypothetical protein